MNKKCILSALFIFSLATKDLHAAWYDYADRKNPIIGAGIILASLFTARQLYNWWTKEPSNEELHENAKQLYDRQSTKYGSMYLLHSSGLLQKEVHQEQELHRLAKCKDIRLVKDISTDLISIERHIKILGKRIQRDQKAGLSEDRDLMSLKNQLISLYEKLKRVSSFVSRYNVYFDLYLELAELDEKYEPLKTVSQVYDRYIARGSRIFTPLQKEVSAAIARLAHASSNPYPRLVRAAQDWQEDLEQILRNIAALKAYIELDTAFKKYDPVARRLSSRDESDLAAKVKAFYIKHDYPFKHAAQTAQEAATEVAQRLAAMENHAILFNAEDGFSPRACDLAKRSQELHIFLVTLPNAITNLAEYAKDLKKERKDKQHTQELALKEEQMRLEHKREQEKIRLEKEKLAAEKAHARAERKARETEYEKAIALQKERLKLERDKMKQDTERSQVMIRDAHAQPTVDPYAADAN